MTQPNPQLADLIAAQEEEYSTWVAAGDIHFGTARAFNEGDPVPKSTVERLGMEAAGQVVKRNSAAGKKIVEATSVVVDTDEFLRQEVKRQSLVDPDAVKASTVKSSSAKSEENK